MPGPAWFSLPRGYSLYSSRSVPMTMRRTLQCGPGLAYPSGGLDDTQARKQFGFPRP